MGQRRCVCAVDASRTRAFRVIICHARSFAGQHSLRKKKEPQGFRALAGCVSDLIVLVILFFFVPISYDMASAVTPSTTNPTKKLKSFALYSNNEKYMKFLVLFLVLTTVGFMIGALKVSWETSSWQTWMGVFSLTLLCVSVCMQFVGIFQQHIRMKKESRNVVVDGWADIIAAVSALVGAIAASYPVPPSC